MKRSVLVSLVAFSLMIGVPRPTMALGPRGDPSPFDGGTTVGRGLPNVLPALPLDPLADLSTFGVSDAELATVGPMASSSSSSDLVVDDNRADCPTAQYTSIQAAVTAAPPGSKIRVCRGTYMEQVTIPAGKDGLELFSTPDLAAVIKAPVAMADPKAIVHVNGANDITIRHFTISGPGGGPCDSLRWGVRVDNGGSALILSNHITLIRDTPFGGCQNGIGVLVGRNSENQTGTAEICHNLIDQYQKGGVVVDGIDPSFPMTPIPPILNPNNSFANVHHNEVIGPGVQSPPTIAANGIQVSRGAGAKVEHNLVSGNTFGLPNFAAGTGILLFGAGSNVSVGYNKVFENDDGISLYTMSGALIEHNSTYDQIFYDGLFAASDATNNTFSHNRSEDNTEHDCHDDSVGARTAGTANTWDKNLGQTENRPGLCKAKGNN